MLMSSYCEFYTHLIIKLLDYIKFLEIKKKRKGCLRVEGQKTMISFFCSLFG